MKKNIRWITETALLLALLICLQWVGSRIPEPTIKQLITGSFVNTVLAVSVLLVSLSSGLTIALISPVLAVLVGIAPLPVTIPVIMMGNAVFVLVHFVCRKKLVWQAAGWIAAAVAKFGMMYAVGVWLFCHVLSGVLGLEGKGVIQLSTMFSWPQLVTALVGGAIALLIAPVLRKALRK